MMTRHQQIYHYFALLINYPTHQLENQARTCQHLLELDYPQAAQHMQKFLSGVQAISLGRMEEIYTGTFDVNPTCFIYAGYMLFGESFKRGRFVVQLQAEYRKYGFDRGDELADHMAVIMRFMNHAKPNTPFVQSLVEDCLIPVLEKMMAGFNLEGDNPYLQLLLSVSDVLEKSLVAEPAL